MQNRIEGLGVDIHQARFTGTFDVSEEDDTSLGLDSVVILLVAARSGQIQHTIRDSGDVVAKRVLKVAEAVPLTGEAREQAIQQMTNRIDPNQGSFEWTMSPGSLEVKVPNQPLSEETPGESAALDETPEPDESDIFVPRAFNPDVGEVEVVGQIRGSRKDKQLTNFLGESYR